VSRRLLPWAAFSAFVLAMGILAALPGKVAVPPPAGAAPDASEGPEIRLGTVEVQEYHDDTGEKNRLTAERASYGYVRKTVTGTGVTVFLAERALRGTTVTASTASWDFERAALRFPEGSRLTREGGWEAEVSPATLDTAGQTLRVPGAATLSGPGITAAGRNLVWDWGNGKISMESPKGRIQAYAVPRRKG
jgi:hypothetical protein